MRVWIPQAAGIIIRATVGAGNTHTHTLPSQTHTHMNTHTLTMSPALVQLISLPRRFLPHWALFPLPHPPAQPWAQPSCNCTLIKHTHYEGSHTHTNTHSHKTHSQTFMCSLMFLEYTLPVWIEESYVFKAFPQLKLLLFFHCRVRNVSFFWSLSLCLRLVCSRDHYKSLLTPAKQKVSSCNTSFSYSLFLYSWTSPLLWDR